MNQSTDVLGFDWRLKFLLSIGVDPDVAAELALLFVGVRP